ncbi:gas vesicle protein [Salsuginibacillus halophilus]|uniref:Gas vesicle protein n=1 Tax=Salsuginibacillus halophilus TaxID=517424 RepID=A0A2P8HXL7_9BACI|nr:YtxH domain-containing protein [Salsuginibacillus halophilus]PSL50976.1 gas vesicle protein [Salsuginibacillus halophilus]
MASPKVCGYLWGLFAGLCTGGILGLLLTPQSGCENRKFTAAKYHQAVEYPRNKADSFQQKKAALQEAGEDHYETFHSLKNQVKQEARMSAVQEELQYRPKK